MNPEFENPFADYSTIVFGERFIGRKESLKTVENRTVRPKESGNLAVIGEPRIGKSSLVYKALIEKKDDLTSKNVLPIWINFGIFDNASAFFSSLVTQCISEMEGLKWLSEPVQHSADRALGNELSMDERYGKILKFFEKVRQAGYRMIFILDEFDHARHIFKGNISDFQKLRDLSYYPKWRITLITTSRRSIRDIEIQTAAASNLAGIFHNHYLGMFNDEDIEEYFKRFSSVGLSLSPKARESIYFYCGGHPYLLEMLGYEIVEIFREKQAVDLEEAVSRTSQSFLNQYDHMTDLLKEDQALEKLIQILFGPVVDVKPIDTDEFLKYGIIRTTSEGTFATYSAHFQIFLNLVGRDIDLWPVLGDTERSLRLLISTIMLETYGENWIERREKKLSSLKAIFDKCREAQQKEENSFGSRSSQNLLDFTYPYELFAIIFAEWENFKSIFGKNKNYWDQRAQLLSKIRNPLAHSRDKALHDYERQLAEGYCNEILTVIGLYKNSE